MALVTLSIPNEKLSLFADLLNSLGIVESTNVDNGNNEMDNHSNSFFKNCFNWENYQNELEFE